MSVHIQKLTLSAMRRPARKTGAGLTGKWTLAFVVGVIGPALGANVREDLYVTNGAVSSAVVSGGVLYIGGGFTKVGLATGQGAAIDAATGQPAFPYSKVWALEVRAVVSDGAGGWYIGGSLGAVNGVPRSGLAHIRADGTVSDWNPNANGSVSALAVSGSTVYAGGSFTSIGGQVRNYIAALDAVTGSATLWNPNASNEVTALAVSGSTVYAGGSFTSIGGQTRNRIAALDAVTGGATSWNPNADNQVSALAVNGETVYAGGWFWNIGGQARNYIAALDAATGSATSWNPNQAGGFPMVRALAVSGSTVYAGGDFSFIGGQLRNCIAALDATTGSVTSWNPNPTGYPLSVRAVAVSDGTVYVGGDFTNIGGQARNCIAALDAATGSAMAWDPNLAGTKSTVHTLAVSDGTVYAGGEFSIIAAQTRNYIAALDVATGRATAWNPNANDGVTVLAVSGGTVYAGGRFTSIGDSTRNKIAALDAATGNATAWDPNALGQGGVYTLVVSGGTVYAGGDFTSIGDSTRNKIAALDAATGNATAWDPNAFEVGAYVRTLAVSGGTVYAGGKFWNIGGQVRHNIAALDAATGSATAWDPNADDVVNALALSGETVYVGGYFHYIRGQARRHIAALDAGGSATTWNPDANNYVNALVVCHGTVYAGGHFTQIDGQVRYLAAALDAGTGSATTWDPLLGYQINVWALALSGDTIFAGGEFPSASMLPHCNLAGIRALTSDVTGSGGATLALLEPNRPNPYGTATTIRFSLPSSEVVTLRVYDVAGRLVATLFDGERRGPGPHQVTFDGRELASGIYLCRLEAGGRVATRRIAILR